MTEEQRLKRNVGDLAVCITEQSGEIRPTKGRLFIRSILAYFISFRRPICHICKKQARTGERLLLDNRTHLACGQQVIADAIDQGRTWSLTGLDENDRWFTQVIDCSGRGTEWAVEQVFEVKLN